MTLVVAVVDDDPRVRQSLENLLESAGYAVRLFSSAESLLHAIDLKHIDCLITDICMPGMDGLALHQVVHRVVPNLPVMLISGCAIPGEALTDLTGIRGFFRKPFDAQFLLDYVGRAIDRR
jgi:FixJ family two-component response regulator